MSSEAMLTAAKAAVSQEIADFRDRLRIVIGQYQEMRTGGKDRTEATCVVMLGLTLGSEDLRVLAAMAAVAVAELAEGGNDAATV